MKRRTSVVVLVVAILVLLAVLLRPTLERQLVASLGDASIYAVSSNELKPAFDGPDGAKSKVVLQLKPVVKGLKQPVDLQFVPGQPDTLVVVQKSGQAVWISLSDPSERGVFLDAKVVTASEQGLLGLAFHPEFQKTGKIYTNATVKEGGREVSQIVEWHIPPGSELRKANPKVSRVLMDVEQPYQNHNAGQLAFGPDGHLYIGWGDGGLAGDPKGHGQNTMTMLGAMLRIDVNSPGAGGKPYAIPGDNPFVGKDGYLPEIWAYGFRNPWRYSFGAAGELIVADVGQDAQEEVTVVQRGENHGWKIIEGRRCYDPRQDCPTDGLAKPVHVYGRHDGTSITGGYVYQGQAIKKLKGQYVFGDFVSGRIWAIPVKGQRAVETREVLALGKWPVLISSFGRDAAGELYLADFGAGRVLKLTPLDD